MNNSKKRTEDVCWRQKNAFGFLPSHGPWKQGLLMRSPFQGKNGPYSRLMGGNGVISDLFSWKLKMEISHLSPTSQLWPLQYRQMRDVHSRLYRRSSVHQSRLILGAWIWKENQVENGTESLLPAAPVCASTACSAFLVSPGPEWNPFCLLDSEPVS